MRLALLIILIVLLLAASLALYFRVSFNNMVKKDIGDFMPDNAGNGVFDPSMTEGLPLAVKRWIDRSGAPGRQMHSVIYIEQDFELKMDPGQNKWYRASARQYVSIREPGFLWTIDLKMMPLVRIRGRDKFVNGNGEMLIKLLSAIPVADEKGNEKINQGSLQRYLAEIVWYPWAAVSPYISWEALDESSARATMEYKGTKGSGTFYFDQDGFVSKFSAMRYMGSDEKAEKREWIIEMEEIGEKNGIVIPVRSRASWILDQGKWTWARINVRSIEPYDPAIHP